MEDIVKNGYLYDFYGVLLTEHQREVYEEAYFNDCSLSEIADEFGISRQAAHDLIKRCDKILNEYEEKLGLLQKFLDMKQDVERMKVITRVIENKDNKKEIEELKQLEDKIYNLL